MASTVQLKVWWKGPGRALPRFRLGDKAITLGELARLYGLPEYAVLARIARGVHPSQWFLAPDELNRLTKREGRRVA
jgi:hypothetical protein